MLPFFIIKRIPPLERKLRLLYMNRAQQIASRITPFISKDDRVLDIGCGTGSVAKVIKKEKSPEMTLIDVQYNPICEEYPIIIYNGQKLPFKNNQFSVSLLTAVLHHCHDSMRVLDEAIRVTSGKIIIMEDVFSDIVGRVITFIGDCVLNWEIRLPFNNKTTEEWLKIFEKKNLTLRHLEEFQLYCVGFPFKLALFVLEKEKTE